MSGADCRPGTCACSDDAAPAIEVHVAGVLIHAHPASLEDVCTAIGLLPRAEVTHRADDGRVVAVLEAPTAHALMHQLEAIRAVRGVLNVALVYQHAEAQDEMDKELEA